MHRLLCFTLWVDLGRSPCEPFWGSGPCAISTLIVCGNQVLIIITCSLLNISFITDINLSTGISVTLVPSFTLEICGTSKVSLDTVSTIRYVKTMRHVV